METKEFEIWNKHKFSRAAIMMLAPFVHILLNSPDFELTEEDKTFVKWYIKFGYLIIWVLALSAIIGAIWYFIDNLVLYRLFNIFSVWISSIWIWLIFVWIFLVHSEKIIFKSGIELWYKHIKSWNSDTILYYIPIYNLILWYQNPAQAKSYWWLKESIIFWTAFSIIWIITSSILILLIMLIFMIFRVVSLIWWIDFISDKYKEKLDKLFDKNPEEIFAYVKAPFQLVFNKIIKKLNYKHSENTLSQFILETKKEYSNLGTTDDKYLIAEYVIFLLINIWIFIEYIINIINFDIMWIISILPWLFIIARYISWLYINKVVYIPVIHEIVTTTKKIIKL